MTNEEITAKHLNGYILWAFEDNPDSITGVSTRMAYDYTIYAENEDKAFEIVDTLNIPKSKEEYFVLKPQETWEEIAREREYEELRF